MSQRRLASPMTLLVLLVIAVGINYVDRGSLSVVKTNVSTEFGFDAAQMGLIFSAFYWSYAISQLVAGWFVDRFDVKWVYAIGFVIWSVATVLMGVSNSFAMMILLRIALGFGESVAYPATSRIIVTNFPEHQRGLANALVDAATKLGPALAMLFGGLIVAQWGWRSLFFTIGIGSLIWLPAWLILVPSQASAEVSSTRRVSSIRFVELLPRREVWGTSLGFFCLGYTWAFLLSWLPAYLEESRGFTKESMAIFGAMPFTAMAATAVLGGWMSDRWIRLGATPTRVRKGFLITGFLLCALFMYAAMASSSDRLCIILLCLACASLGLYSSNAWALTQTLAGPRAAGQWTGLQNAIGNVGSALSPAITGWLVKETGTYSSAFVAASVILIAGVFAYVLLVPKVVPLDWGTTEEAST